MIDPFGLCREDAQDQGTTSKYQWLHNILGGAGFFWDGFDIANGFLYMMEGKYVDAAISFACGIPAVGNVIAGVAKASKVAKAMSVANKVAEASAVVGKVGNAASGAKAVYDTHKEAQKLETTGEKMAYYGLTAISSYVLGKTGQWAAGKVKNLFSKAMPKVKTTLRRGVDKLFGKIHFNQNRNKLISATQNRLHTKILNGKTSKKKLGPALAGVLDTKTGNIFFGENDFLGNEPTKIHPLIKTRIETAKTIKNAKTKGAGSHAEVYALNEALLAREDAALDDFMVYVISTKN